MKIEANIAGLVELISNVTEAYTTAVFLADNEKRVLRLWHFYSLGDNVISDASIPFGVGPIGWVAENKEDFDISKFFERDSSLLRLYSKNENIKSFFAVPILSKDGILEGVICIDSKKAFVFSNRQQKLLKLFAYQVADLINNTRVSKFIDTEISDIAFLREFCREISASDNVETILQLTLRSIVKLVECEGYFISLQIYNGEPNIFRISASHGHRDIKGLTFSDRDGLAGCVIKGREPFLLSNRREELGSYIFSPSESVGRVRSFLGVPLSVRGGVLGVICLIDSREGAFNQRDLQVISIIADNVSLAIDSVRAQEKVHALSTNTDGLTGLYNFIGFQECLEAAFRTMSQKRRPLSLLIMDIDGFKDLNDTFGYEVGNEVLRQFSNFLLDIKQDQNFEVARYGADEFALILPNVTREQASSIAEEICRMVKDPTFIKPSMGVRISVSIGISSFPQDSPDKDKLANNALRALSVAKSYGSGKASFYNAKSYKVI